MTVPGNIDALLLGGQRGYQIERSLRFNSADSAYLNRTPASAGNQKTWTWSAWVKRSSFGSLQFLLQASNDASISFSSSDTLELNLRPATTNYNIITTQVFRDPSAWYHIVCAVDTTLATADDRLRMWINGVQVTAFGTRSNPTPSMDGGINNASTHYIGKYYASANYFFNGYLTENYFIDGQALTASSFGETDTITGVWKPKRYSGSGYGTNGFYLNFKDNSSVAASTLGKDYSGNGNNWTPSATFSVTAGAGNDSLTDVPTNYADGLNGRGNHCTLSPLDTDPARTTAIGLANGNLDASVSTYGTVQYVLRGATMASNGKDYFEVTKSDAVNKRVYIGFLKENGVRSGAGVGGTPVDFWGYATGDTASANTGFIVTDGTAPTTGLPAVDPGNSGDVIMVAHDRANKRIWFGKNGTWFTIGGTVGDPATGTAPAITYTTNSTLLPCIGAGSFTNTTIRSLNFGQRDFAYTPPSGFKALNTQNLPELTIKKPSSYFDVKTWTATGTDPLAVSGLGFSPDLVWAKARNDNYNHVLVDQVRGVNNVLSSNSSNNEASYTTVTQFNSDGFNAGGTTNNNYSLNCTATISRTYVAWCWDESVTPGFDIVTYTGNGTNGRQIAHNLGVRPSMYITACRTGATNYWNVWHSGAQSGDASERYQLWLYSTSGRNASGFPASTNTLITSTNFTPAIVSYDNVNTATYVAYLWSEVAGFSKFGSYTGNGVADGPFVFCGFRPRWVMVKRTDTSGYDWEIYDSARADSNVIGNRLWANLSTLENSATRIDFLSNGFKIRDSGGQVNGGTIIFAAFAESPAKYSLAR